MNAITSRGRLLIVTLVAALLIVLVALRLVLLPLIASRPDYADIYYTPAEDERRSLDIYLPADEHLPAPVVIMLHGGLGNKADFRETANQLTPLGFAVVLPSYRIDPMTYEDGFCALAWVHANAAQYRLDAERITVIGWSSGGGIAAEMLAVNDPADLLGDCPHAPPADWLNGAVLLAAGSDRWMESGWRTDQPPLTWIGGNEPPVLLIHGEQDDLIPAADSRQLASVLESAGDDVDLLLLPESDHFFPVPGNAGYDQMLQAVTTFLQETAQ